MKLYSRLRKNIIFEVCVHTLNVLNQKNQIDQTTQRNQKVKDKDSTPVETAALSFCMLDKLSNYVTLRT